MPTIAQKLRQQIYWARAAASGGGGGVTDHGALTGLADDDHSQYHNNARGDARYPLIAHDHNGGDGGTIAYSSLSGAPTVLTHPQILARGLGS